jgi:hypothetical protein
VFQDEADKDVVEGFSGEWQGEDVRLLEPHIADTRGSCCPPGFR